MLLNSRTSSLTFRGALSPLALNHSSSHTWPGRRMWPLSHSRSVRSAPRIYHSNVIVHYKTSSRPPSVSRAYEPRQGREKVREGIIVRKSRFSHFNWIMLSLLSSLSAWTGCFQTLAFNDVMLPDGAGASVPLAHKRFRKIPRRIVKNIFIAVLVYFCVW